MQAPEQIFGIGQFVFGKFEILAQLGAGNMGQVYKVRDTNLDKELALKVLHAHARDEKDLVRFQNEAKTSSRLAHRCIATVYDFGLSEDGSPYLAIEFIEGMTLEALLSRGRLALLEFLSIFSDVAEALDCAHRNGIVHRDIKPGNIMLVRQADGLYLTKVVDFGIAKKVDATDSGAQQQTTGSLMGTPRYMSPEQCRGGSATSRSDLYSLGCVMYEALAGEPPFVAANLMELLLMHQNAAPRPLQDLVGEEIPASIFELIDALLSKSPDDRLESASEVQRILETEIGEIEKAATEDSLKQRKANDDEKSSEGNYPRLFLRRDHNDKRLIVGMIAVALLAVAILTYFVAFRYPAEQVSESKISYEQSGAFEPMSSRVLGDNGAEIVAKKADEEARKGRLAISADDIKSTDFEEWTGVRRTSDDLGSRRKPTDADAADHEISVTRIKSEMDKNASQFYLVMHEGLQDADMELFENYQPVQEIVASGLPLTDRGVQHFHELKNLKILNLQETNVTKLSGLTGLDSIREINLEHSNVTDEALETVSKLKNLRTLKIRETAITTAGLKKLVDMPFLTAVQISVPTKYITEKQFLEFAEKNPNCRFLSTEEYMMTFYQAAQKAFEKKEYRTALRFYTALTNLIKHYPLKYELRLAALTAHASCCRVLKNEQAEPLYKEALAIAIAEKKVESIKILYDGLFHTYIAQKRHSEAESILKKYIALMDSNGDLPVPRLFAVREMAGAYERSRNFEKAKQWRKIACAIKTLTPLQRAAALSDLAHMQNNCGERKAAIANFEKSVPLLRQIARKQNRADANDYLGIALYQYAAAEFARDNHEKALELNAEGIAVLEKPLSSVFILEGLVMERLAFFEALKRTDGLPELKAKIAKVTAKRVATQKAQAAAQ
jgi:serine/threonine protein kinase/tetratricopeptide (TPR) repeat protein